MKLLVTGGCGFIGSAVCRHAVGKLGWDVLNVDALTYAATQSSLNSIADRPNYHFLHANINDRARIDEALSSFRPDAIMHLAAESHVDRSIDAPMGFVETNVVGTVNLLESARKYHKGLPASQAAAFRFHHVSTDEVFGSLSLEDPAFSETTAYAPSSPYSASKAASDHFVRAYHETYGLPVVMSNCSNNYGPFHFPEKLIPLMIVRGLSHQSLPVYGQGSNVRDWLHVEDHARALSLVLTRGRPGESYNIGGEAERSNLAVVEAICDGLDELSPTPGRGSRRDLIRFVDDRPGHDLRYAIDARKVRRELGWQPEKSFEQGLQDTIKWFLDNSAWWQPLLQARYAGERLGKG